MVYSVFWSVLSALRGRGVFTGCGVSDQHERAHRGASRAAAHRHFAGMCALVVCLGGCTLPSGSAIAPSADGFSTQSGRALAQSDALTAADNAKVLEAIAESQVIYLGETHTDAADHAAQLEIIKALGDRGEIALGLEMFQRPFQAAVDAYLAGDITEAEMVAQTEYESRWGYDWELYAPILRYAQENQVPVVALNTPTEVTRKVAGEGLAALSGDELTHIPPVADIDTTDEDYQAAISEVFSAHGGAGHSLSFDNFFAAQVLWDETMAEAVVTQLQSDPQRQVIVLAGEGHIAYHYGIPNRVERRLADVQHASVRLVPPDMSAAAVEDAEFADWIWVTNPSQPD